jgi:hypothetical protein
MRFTSTFDLIDTLDPHEVAQRRRVWSAFFAAELAAV